MGLETDLRVSVTLVEKVKAAERREGCKYCVGGKDKDREAKTKANMCQERSQRWPEARARIRKIKLLTLGSLV